MERNLCVGIATVCVVLLLCLGMTSVITRQIVAVQLSVTQLSRDVEKNNNAGFHEDLVELQQRLSSIHAYQNNLRDSVKKIDDITSTIDKQSARNNTVKMHPLDSPTPNQQQFMNYTKAEIQHIITLLDEIKIGFIQYETLAKQHEDDVLKNVAGVISSFEQSNKNIRGQGNIDQLDYLPQADKVQQQAQVAANRRDLPILLPSVRLLIGILSGPSNVDRRNEVRQTWVKHYRKSLGVARQWSIWFLVSSPKSEDEAKQIQAEALEYGDIMLMSYLTEDYHLIGAKVVEFFHAASLFPQLQFVMKADDDTFVRVDRLLAQLDEHREGNLFLGCNMGKMPPIRNENNKRYFVSTDEYSPSSYPRYCSGGGYVISMDVVRAFDGLSQASGYEPFKFEDVNTGMLIDQTGLQIKPTQGKGFYCWGPPKKSTEISQLQKDWVVYHYVGGKKKWTMAKLLSAVQKDGPTLIVQKRVRFEISMPLKQWVVKEIEIYSDDKCSASASLAKAFGIGVRNIFFYPQSFLTLSSNRDDKKATTWQNTVFGASSNKDTANLAFDGQTSTAWESEKQNKKHSILLSYGVHSVPLSDIQCLKIIQGQNIANRINVYFWDDDDARWQKVGSNIQLKQGTKDTYLISGNGS